MRNEAGTDDKPPQGRHRSTDLARGVKDLFWPELFLLRGNRARQGDWRNGSRWRRRSGRRHSGGVTRRVGGHWRRGEVWVDKLTAVVGRGEIGAAKRGRRHEVGVVRPVQIPRRGLEGRHRVLEKERPPLYLAR